MLVMMRLWAGLVLVCAAAAGPLSSRQLPAQHLPVPRRAAMSPRATVNFDFGWRFQPAQEPRYQQCSFEQGVNYGIGQISALVVPTKEQCCNECANHDTCRAWDWNGHWCWLKDNSVAKTPEAGRWSGRLGAPWPENASWPAQSQPEYNDADWEVVDAPHDFGRHRMLKCQATGRRQLASDWGGNSTDFVNNCRSAAWPILV